MKILEVSKELDPMTPMKPLTLYIDRKSYLLEAPPIAANFPSHWLSYPRRRAPLQYQDGTSKKEDKGRCFPRAGHHRGALCYRRRRVPDSGVSRPVGNRKRKV
jgi:hypothetical protein